MTAFTASMIIEPHQKLTLDDLRLFHGLTDGFPDDARLDVHGDGIYLTWCDGKDIVIDDQGISEWEKELLEKQRLEEELRAQPPRDELGGFTKRK